MIFIFQLILLQFVVHADANMKCALKAKQWCMVVEEHKGQSVKVIFKDLKTKKPGRQWQSPEAPFFILDKKLVTLKGHEYAVTKWSHGAHSETLRIFDPLKEKVLVYEKTSSWDITYEIGKDRIDISYSDEMSINDSTPILESDVFRP